MPARLLCVAYLLCVSCGDCGQSGAPLEWADTLICHDGMVAAVVQDGDGIAIAMPSFCGSASFRLSCGDGEAQVQDCAFDESHQTVEVMTTETEIRIGTQVWLPCELSDFSAQRQ